MNHALSFFIPMMLSVLAVGCNTSRSSNGTIASSSPVSSGVPAISPLQTQVTHLVFIDKQNACNCTRARVAKGWDALQSALGGRATPSVERLYVDTQPEQVQKYRQMRPMMAVPALYFLNASDALVDQLQGEFTTQQIQAIFASKH